MPSKRPSLSTYLPTMIKCGKGKKTTGREKKAVKKGYISFSSSPEKRHAKCPENRKSEKVKSPCDMPNHCILGHIQGVKILDVVTSAVWLRYACAGKIKTPEPRGKEIKSISLYRRIAALLPSRPTGLLCCARPGLPVVGFVLRRPGLPVQ
jgi:hypothetical protein